MYIVTKKSGEKLFWALYAMRDGRPRYLCALPRSVFKRKPKPSVARRYYLSLKPERLAEEFRHLFSTESVQRGIRQERKEELRAAKMATKKSDKCLKREKEITATLQKTRRERRVLQKQLTKMPLPKDLRMMVDTASRILAQRSTDADMRELWTLGGCLTRPFVPTE